MVDVEDALQTATLLPTVSTRRRSTWGLREMLMLLVMAAVGGVVTFDLMTSRHLLDWYEAFLHLCNTLLPLQMIAVFTLAVAITQPVAAPITVLSMGGGFLFCTRFGTATGLLLGTACTLTGALSGAVLAFALSRQVALSKSCAHSLVSASCMQCIKLAHVLH
jgi:uncharacterized membrane protein YdjX (TVP38/TMEM64 family)